MINLKIERFGGVVLPNNDISISVGISLSADVDKINLGKSEQVIIPSTETEIYNLVNQLQPLVYEYCRRVLLNSSNS